MHKFHQFGYYLPSAHLFIRENAAKNCWNHGTKTFACPRLVDFNLNCFVDDSPFQIDEVDNFWPMDIILPSDLDERCWPLLTGICLQKQQIEKVKDMYMNLVHVISS